MRRLLQVLVAATVLVLLVDLARPSWTAPLRAVAAQAVSPVQQQLGWGPEGDRLRAERDEQMIGSGAAVVTARVVGLPAATSPVGVRELTIDEGRDAGVRPDDTVVTAQGLVGRVLRVHAQTSDILLLGDPAVVVGVRYGPERALGVLSAEEQPGLPARRTGELTLTALGDQVQTIGSPGGRPYVADVPVGAIIAVDPDVGQLGRTAVLRPVVDLDSLDHVVVLQGPG
jgi:rod shape-determining protein MreC